MKNSTNDPTCKRKRGAPTGNTNALKHGFYSKRFNRGDIEDLRDMDIGTLRDEIGMLRVITRKTADLLKDDNDPEKILDVCKTVGTLCTNIAALLRAERRLEGNQDPIMEIMQALDEAMRDQIHIERPGLAASNSSEK